MNKLLLSLIYVQLRVPEIYLQFNLIYYKLQYY